MPTTSSRTRAGSPKSKPRSKRSGAASSPPEGPPQVALITGFPRLLARGLTRRILNEHPESRVRLLVPPDQSEAATAFHARLPEAGAARTTFHPGAMRRVDLGLPGPDVSRILAETTHVYHAATAQTGGRSALRRQNVGGLSSILLFARDMDRLERVCFFSTAFVSGDRAGVIYEEDLECGQRLRTAFEHTMFAAERVARELMPWIPITVLRPGSMLGHSRTGEAEALSEGPNYLVRLLVKLPAEVPLPLPGSGVVPLNIVPIDYVVRAACVLARRPEAVGRTFHLTDPNPLSARQAFEILSDVAHRPTQFTGRVPFLRQVMRLPGIARLMPNHLSIFESLTTHVTYDCSGALELLAGSDVVCPPFESYADQLVSWVAHYERTARQNAEPGGPIRSEEGPAHA